MKQIPIKLWLLIFASAILQVIIFPVAGPLPTWRASIAIYALVPMLIALQDVRLSLRNVAILSYLCGVLWYLGTCYWVYSTMHIYGGLSVPMGLFVMLLFCLYLGLYHLLFGFLFAYLSRHLQRWQALVAMPFLWVAVEMARTYVTGFPWNLLGYSAVTNLWTLLMAPIGGVMMVSFLVACGNAAIALAYLLVRKSEPSYTRRKSIAGTVLALLTIGFIGGSQFHPTPYDRPGDQTAVMLQPNLDVGAEAHGLRRDPLQDAMQLSMTDQPRTVTLWPESPALLATDDPLIREKWMLLASKTNAPLIAGSIGMKDTFKGRYLYNSAAVIDPDSGYVGHYDKMHLVPFGEYVPFESVFSFASGLTQEVGHFQPGEQRTIFHTGGHAYGIFICYESIFGDEVREFARNGAEVLVNLSDDGWYGDTSAPFQHLNMARMRAIENHRWVLRDTNNGITGSIDPNGVVHDTIPRHTAGIAVARFAFDDTCTFYTEHGDWFGWLCVIVTLASCGYAQICKMKTC
ncbi:MAG: apolipoprotein N-acyltransferase [Acidobacteria bacterium]|nr:apolipoprotein N-acyltransferase [Acidobacteriota bacterium]